MAALPRPPVCTEDPAQNHVLIGLDAAARSRHPEMAGLATVPCLLSSANELDRSLPHDHPVPRVTTKVLPQDISGNAACRPVPSAAGKAWCGSMGVASAGSAYQAPIQASSIPLTPGTAAMIMQRFQRWKSANLRQWQALRRLGIAGGALAAVAFGFASWPAALAQTAGGRAQPLITQSVNDGNLFRLAGNTRPEAQNAANDRGRVADAMPMPHLMLQLRRPAAQEQALANADRSTARPELAELPPLAHGKRNRRAVRPRRVRHRDRHQLAHAAWLHRQYRLSKRHGDRIFRHRRASSLRLSHRYSLSRR